MSLSTITSTSPLNFSITFDEAKHVYYDSFNPLETYVSATQFIHTFSQPFDKLSVSEYIAKRDGLTQEEVLKRWERKANIACEFGHKVHETVENFIKNKITLDDIFYLKFDLNPDMTSSLRNVVRTAINYVIKIQEKFDILGVEKIVFDKSSHIAGTIDLLTQHKQTKDICIFDWKTNDEIRMDNRYQNMLYPVDYLPDCNYSHYSLQLSLYQYLLKKGGYIPKSSTFFRYLIHINKNNKSSVIKIPDLTNDIINMISYKKTLPENINQDFQDIT